MRTALNPVWAQARLDDHGEPEAHGGRKADELAKDGVPSRLTDLLEAMPEGVALCDAHGHAFLVNQAFEAIRALAGNALTSLFALEKTDFTLAAEQWCDLADGGEDVWLETRLARHLEPCRMHSVQLADGSTWLHVEERHWAGGQSVLARVDGKGAGRIGLPSEVLFAGSPLPMYVFERATFRFLAVNKAAIEYYGRSREEFDRLTLFDIRPKHEHARLLRALGDPDPNCGDDQCWTHLDAEGNEVAIIGRHQQLMFQGRPATLVTIVDQTGRLEIEQELMRIRSFLDNVVENVPIAVFAKDLRDEGRYVVYNRAGEVLLGRPRECLLGLTDHDIFGPEVAERFAAQDAAVVREGVLHTIAEESVTRGDGEVRTIQTKKLPIPDGPSGNMRYILGISEDITERRRYEARISYMAHHDALTSLPNRSQFRERLEAALVRTASIGERVEILCLDLDNFKEINDSLGHHTGDLLLCAVAKRLRESIGASDFAARLGGDEFAVLRAQSGHGEEAGALAAHVISRLSAPYDIEGQRLLISASVGIAKAPSDGVEFAALMKKADLALYCAKGRGRGTFCFYQSDPCGSSQPQARCSPAEPAGAN